MTHRAFQKSGRLLILATATVSALFCAPRAHSQPAASGESSSSTDIALMLSDKSDPLLIGESRRKYDTLMLIIEDAEKAKSSDERQQTLWEFMGKSEDFLSSVPAQTNIWLLRAVSTMELDYPVEGWLAGKKLKDLGMDGSTNLLFRSVLANLDRKGWLADQPAYSHNKIWSNQECETLASNGNVMAQFNLGLNYSVGASGYAVDCSQAVKWFRKAALAGYVPAEKTLGQMFEEGKCVTKDDDESAQWYNKAAIGNARLAEAGDAEAEQELAFAYSSGHGEPKDISEATKWGQKAVEGFLKEASNGDPYSQDCLGLMYASGAIIPKNVAEAKKWYRKSAAAGDVPGQANLAALLRDDAEKGDAASQLELGTMYENGFGGSSKNLTEATKWYHQAADQGSQDAKKALERIQAAAQTQ